MFVNEHVCVGLFEMLLQHVINHTLILNIHMDALTKTLLITLSPLSLSLPLSLPPSSLSPLSLPLSPPPSLPPSLPLSPPLSPLPLSLSPSQDVFSRLADTGNPLQPAPLCGTLEQLANINCPMSAIIPNTSNSQVRQLLSSHTPNFLITFLLHTVMASLLALTYL